MNPKQLQYFLTVYETQNIQRAAEKLFVSRQGVSKIIRAMEKELHASLFHRSPKGIEPTDFAKTLLPHAKKLLEEYEFILGVNALAKQEKSLVTLYALDHVMEYLSADFLLDLRKACPDMILSVVETTDEGVLDALLSHKADLAISTGPVDQTRFQAVPLFFTHYCVAVRKTHPLAEKESIRYKDIDGRQIISKGRAYRCFRSNVDHYIFAQGLTVDILAEISDIEVALDLASRSDALYIAYDYMAVMHRRPDILWKPLEEEVQGQEMFLFWPKEALPRKVCRDFQNFLTDWLPRHGKDEVHLFS